MAKTTPLTNVNNYDLMVVKSMKPTYNPIRKTFVIDQQLLDLLTRRANAHKTSHSYELRQIIDEYLAFVSKEGLK